MLPLILNVSSLDQKHNQSSSSQLITNKKKTHLSIASNIRTTSSSPLSSLKLDTDCYRHLII